MEQNKFLLLTIIVIFANLAYAQEPGYYIDYSGLKPRIMQKFVWDNEENAMQYDVKIQAYSEKNELFDFNKTTTLYNYIDVYLPPGKYRYSVTAFDYLGRPGETSEWIDFEIITALHPVIDQFSPNSFFLDQNKKRDLIVSGNNLSEESTIYLRSSLHDLFPVSMNFISKNMFELSFDDETLKTGSYEIYAINPGGLESVVGNFVIDYRKFFDIFFKAAYMPVIPLYGKLKDEFPDTLYTAGVFAAAEFIYSWRLAINAGIEISYSTYLLNSFVTLDFGLSDALFGLSNNNGMVFNDFDVNISLQKRFNKRKMAVTLRFGCGFSFINDNRISDNTGSNSTPDKSNEFDTHLNVGLSYMFLIYDNFYLDLGADFDHHITGSSSGIIKPKIAFVWKF